MEDTQDLSARVTMLQENVLRWEDRLQSDSGFEIYVMNADGSNQVNLTPDSTWENLNHDGSPDGTRITWERWERGETRTPGDVWVMDADGSNKINLTNTPDILDRHPDWSPDGSKIAFVSHRHDNRDIYVMDADGSNEIRLTTTRVSTSSRTGDRWRSSAGSIAVDNEGFIYVADVGNKRIQKFAP